MKHPKYRDAITRELAENDSPKIKGALGSALSEEEIAELWERLSSELGAGWLDVTPETLSVFSQYLEDVL